MKIFLIILLSFCSTIGYTKTIQQLFTKEFMTCTNESDQIFILIDQLRDDVNSSQKMKQYTDIYAYKMYDGYISTQHDFNVNFYKNNLHIVKFSLVSTKEVEDKNGELISTESSGYYIIFKNSKEDVKKNLKLSLDADLSRTPQGNTKLMCVIAG